MDNCIFCKIARKEIPAAAVYEDDEMMAFKDIRPAAPVHLLLIPKQHVATLSDCGAEHEALLGRMMTRVAKLAAEHGCAAVKGADGQYSGGFRTQVHSGPSGGQEVYHLHIHLIGTPAS